MAGSIDLLVADIERIGALVAELMGLEKMKTPEKIMIIKSIYEDGYNINSDELNLDSEKIIEILNLNDSSILNIRKINNLINTIEVDISLNASSEKTKVLKSLLLKVNNLDSKNYSIERTKRIEKLNRL